MYAREDFEKMDINELRSIKTDIYWALKSKEDEEKVTLFGVEEYTGIQNYFLNFENALKYVLENTEVAYRKGLKQYLEEGRPSYIDFKGFGLKIITKLVLPCDVDGYFPVDKEGE